MFHHGTENRSWTDGNIFIIRPTSERYADVKNKTNFIMRVYRGMEQHINNLFINQCRYFDDEYHDRGTLLFVSPNTTIFEPLRGWQQPPRSIFRWRHVCNFNGIFNKKKKIVQFTRSRIFQIAYGQQWPKIFVLV